MNCSSCGRVMIEHTEDMPTHGKYYHKKWYECPNQEDCCIKTFLPEDKMMIPQTDSLFANTFEYEQT